MTRLRVLVAVLALWTVLGCEDEPTPNIPDPSPSSSVPSPSGTESSASPSPSVEAMTPEETVRAWVDAWNAALQSGDLAGLRALQTEDCRNCANVLAVVEDVFAAGGSFMGGEWSIDKAVPVEQAASRVKLTVGMSIAAGATVNAAGEQPVSYEADKRLVIYELIETSGGWRINVIELQS